MQYTPADLVALNGDAYEHFFGQDDEDALLAIATDEDSDSLQVQCFLAESAVLPESVIRALLRVPDSFVRACLAGSCQVLPADVEDTLARSDVRVREFLAGNSSISLRSQRAVLEGLAEKNLRLVATRLAENRSIDPSIQGTVFELAEEYDWRSALAALAENPSVTTEVQGKLSLHVAHRLFVWRSLGDNESVRFGPHLAVSFLKVFYPKDLTAPEGVDAEAFYSLASNWAGTLAGLVEACDLVNR